MASPAGPPPGVLVLNLTELGAPPPLNSVQAAARLAKTRETKFRSLPGSACLRCRKRKVRCDGGSPCSFCAARDGICVYGTPTTPMDTSGGNEYRAAVTTMSLAALRGGTAAGGGGACAPSTFVQRAESLVDSFRRVHYLQMYMKHVHTFGPIMRIDEGFSNCSFQPRSVAEQLQETVALAFSTRALGEVDVALRFHQQARSMVGAVTNDGLLESIAAVFMIGFFMIGEDKDVAHHYCVMAQKMMSKWDGPTGQHVIHWIISTLNILHEGKRPLPAAGQGALTEAVAFPAANKGPAEQFNTHTVPRHPLLVDLIDWLQRFPVQSEAQDLFASMRSTVRMPMHMRTNTPLSGTKVDMMLRCLELGEMGEVVENLPLYDKPDAHLLRIKNRCSVLWGLRMFICTAGGLVTLGAHYARRTLDSIIGLAGAGVGFSLHNIYPAMFALASFLTVYREYVDACSEGAVSFRSLLLEMCDVVRPIGPFKPLKLFIELCERHATSDSIPALPPSVDDIAVSAQWMVPAREPRSYDDLADEFHRSRREGSLPSLPVSPAYQPYGGKSSSSGSLSRAASVIPQTPDVVPMEDVDGSAAPSWVDSVLMSPMTPLPAPLQVACDAPTLIRDTTTTNAAIPGESVNAYPGMVSPQGLGAPLAPPPDMLAAFGLSTPGGDAAAPDFFDETLV